MHFLDFDTLTSPEGVTEELSYNTLNMVTDISVAGKLLMTMDYDNKGNLTTATDALGNETHYSYAEDGKVTGIADEIGTIHLVTYDDDGNVVSMTDGRNNKTLFDYDDEGNVKSVTVSRTESDGNIHNYTCRYVYDNAGNITASISNTGKVTTYEYDYRNCNGKIVAIYQVGKVNKSGTIVPRESRAIEDIISSIMNSSDKKAYNGAPIIFIPYNSDIGEIVFDF